MGQKTHPIGFRLGVSKTWSSRWYATKGNYHKQFHEDRYIRKEIRKRLAHTGVSHIDIERAAGKVTVNIFTSRPGLVIGKKGAGIDSLRMDLQTRVVDEGIRIQCSGRLGGAEIARREWYREGRVPLHTLRADVDYGFAEAKTTYGIIGIKAWVYKGEVMPERTVRPAMPKG